MAEPDVYILPWAGRTEFIKPELETSWRWGVAGWRKMTANSPLRQYGLLVPRRADV